MDDVRSYRIAAGLGFLGVAFSVIWPGDVPWINDEPVFIQRALSANAAHTLPATAGLTGSAGIPYGPLAIWIYQFLLLFVSDLTHLVMLKAALCQATAFWVLLRLSRDRDWPLTPAVWFAFSPFFWFYSRILWDNGFLIPVSAVAFASGIRFYHAPSVRSLAVWAVASTGMLLLHLMAIPLILAMAVWNLRQHTFWLKRHWGAVLAVGIACLALSAPYWFTLLQVQPGPTAHPNLRPGSALSNALMGFQLFTAWGFFERFVPQALEGSLGWGVRSLSVFTLLGSVFFLFGLARRSDYRSLWLMAVSLALAISIASRLAHHTHYLNALWPVSFPLLVIGVERVQAWRLGRALCHLYTGALVLCVYLAASATHATGGNRSQLYGPVLSEQIRVSREIPKTAQVKSIPTEVANVAAFPHALQFLVDRYGKGSGSTPRLLRYRYSDPPTGWLELEPSP